MAVPHASRSSADSWFRPTTLAHEQAPAAANSGSQQERIDGMSVAEFWARVDVEKRDKIGTVLHGLRADMHDQQRPCVPESHLRNCHTLSGASTNYSTDSHANCQMGCALPINLGIAATLALHALTFSMVHCTTRTI